MSITKKLLQQATTSSGDRAKAYQKDLDELYRARGGYMYNEEKKVNFREAFKYLMTSGDEETRSTAIDLFYKIGYFSGKSMAYFLVMDGKESSIN